MKTFGLIGYSLSHSFSPSYFASKFEREGILNSEYLPFELKQIDDFKRLLEDRSLSGLNVTIPYKEQVIPFLDELSETAQVVGAVNTIQFQEGKLIGHNTDVIGFERSIASLLNEDHKQAYILGTGGAAKAVEFALKRMNLAVQYVSRKASDIAIAYEDLKIQKGDVIVNSTPLGMYPKVDACPAIQYDQLDDSNVLFDLVYNPEITMFMQKGLDQGAQVKNGLEMLHGQAEAAWEIWNA
jgi:shikimate dehydrogenase